MRGVHECPRRHKTRGINPHLPHHQRVFRPSGYKHSVIYQQATADQRGRKRNAEASTRSRRTKRAMGDERAEQLKKMEKELREVRDPIRSSAETLKRKNELKRQLQESKGGDSKKL
ncbi:hypothetical protein E4U15_001770 [Claviceps sp. LM218 group G6]|nr:hypothetical protein E4U15_001770 [Claviceps sp. LM218 group G6]